MIFMRERTLLLASKGAFFHDYLFNEGCCTVYGFYPLRLWAEDRKLVPV